jgi:cell division protein FtsI (penicillin-binding protein 3)
MKELNVRYQQNNEAEWLKADTAAQRLQVSRKVISQKKVPNVLGMTAKDAVYILESKGLVVRMTGMGRVTSQSIQPGNQIVKGQVVQLKLN